MDLKTFLEKSPLTNAQRARAWDVFYDSPDTDALTSTLSGVDLPRNVKAGLWDIKSGAEATLGHTRPNAEDMLGAVKEFGEGAWEGAKNLAGMPGQIAQSQFEKLFKAKNEYESGNTMQAAMDAASGLTPLMPMAQAEAERSVHQVQRAGEELGKGEGLSAINELAKGIPVTGGIGEELGGEVAEGRPMHALGKGVAYALAPEAAKRVPGAVRKTGPALREAAAITKDAVTAPGFHFFPKTFGEFVTLSVGANIAGPVGISVGSGLFVAKAIIHSPKMLKAIRAGRAARKGISEAKAQGELLKMSDEALYNEITAQKTPEGLAILDDIRKGLGKEGPPPQKVTVPASPIEAVAAPKPLADYFRDVSDFEGAKATVAEVIGKGAQEAEIVAAMIEAGFPEPLALRVFKDASKPVPDAPTAPPEATMPPRPIEPAPAPPQPLPAPEGAGSLPPAPVEPPAPIEPVLAPGSPGKHPYVPPVDPIMDPATMKGKISTGPVYDAVRNAPGYQALVEKIRGLPTEEAVSVLVDAGLQDWLIAPTVEAAGGVRPAPKAVRAAVNAAQDAAYDARMAELLAPKGDVVTAPPAFPGQQGAPFVKGRTLPGAEDRLSYLQRTAAERGDAPARVAEKIAENKTKGSELAAALEGKPVSDRLDVRFTSQSPQPRLKLAPKKLSEMTSEDVKQASGHVRERFKGSEFKGEMYDSDGNLLGNVYLQDGKG
ncbi:MAG: hypothetical protein E4G90_08170, partial [Gemmatimonadales bacterium]